MDYAHEYEMELIWGFAWGWSTDCRQVDLKNLDKLKNSIIEKFKTEYMGVGDGIYFQSFTELRDEKISDVLIAEAVVELVNETAAEIYKLSPDIHIQFGLHASSVKKHLSYFENVDEIIEIVWEDCGSFPYSYTAQIELIQDFSEVEELTDKIIHLRNMGKTGLVYKGLMTLDWSHFEHQKGPYILGVNSKEPAKEDVDFLTPMWRTFSEDWIRFGRFAYDFTKKLNEKGYAKLNMNVLAQLAGGIWFPFALLSEILWSTDDSYDEILQRVMKKKCFIMP